MNQVGFRHRAEAVLVDLYGGVFNRPFETFKQTTLAVVRRVIPFDMAVWGSGVYSSNAMLSVSMLDFPPTDLLAYASRWQADDFVRSAAVAEPGRAFRNEDVMPLAQYHQTPIYLEYSKPAGIEHALGVVEHDPLTDLGEMIFLFRSRTDAAFEDEDCSLLEHLSLHLMTAWRQAQIAHHYRALADGSASGFFEPESYAVADGQGLLHAAGAEFCHALQAVEPGWRGPTLPPALAPLTDRDGATLTIGRCEFTARRQAGISLLAVASGGGALGLSPAEARVARLYAAGLTQREIARRAGVSPSTVRNQLASVFAKLGVHSKVELIQALSRPPPA
jgi:DNA-binding CsgD family transcriptional regulator